MKSLSVSVVRSIFLSAFTLTCVVTRVASADELPPGLVAERPADGPAVETEAGFMVPYTQELPGTNLTIEMVPVPGGVARVSVAPFDAEDPAAQPETDEHVEVELPPFWIAKHETSWAAYWRYMELDASYAAMQQLRTLTTNTPDGAAADALAEVEMLTVAVSKELEFGAIDAVTAPTPLYDSSTTYESGREPDLPAVSMTTFAAKQFTKWLSRLTRVDYRLPSEAEWVHAATVGGSDEPGDLDGVAWYVDNSDWVAKPVGEKSANTLGMHDMLGNVAELVLDAAAPDGRPELAGKRVGWAEAIVWPTESFSMIAKGGHYDSEAEEVGVATRLVTNEEWKDADPQLPRSPWWFASYPSNGVGFRLVRPLEPVDEALAEKVWDAASPTVLRDVAARVRGGRGKVGWIAPELPRALEELGSPDVQSLLK